MKTRIRLKLARAEGRKNVRGRFEVSKLQSKEIRRRYNIEERNRFEDLFWQHTEIQQRKF